MNQILNNIFQQIMAGKMQGTPMMNLFNQMMHGKSQQEKIQTLLNSAKSRGIDINKKMFSENDLKSLKLK